MVDEKKLIKSDGYQPSAPVPCYTSFLLSAIKEEHKLILELAKIDHISARCNAEARVKIMVEKLISFEV